MSEQPVLIGVGDFVNRSKKPEDAKEPLKLILSAFDIAINDTGLQGAAVKRLTSEIDSVLAVRTWTWPYPDLSTLIAEHLSIKPKYTKYSDHGGNSPVQLLDEAAKRISKGESRIALIAGAEALASCTIYSFHRQHLTDQA